MTAEEQDALVGRVIRESRAAEDELRQLLVKAEQKAADISRLAQEVQSRAGRAKAATAPPPPPNYPAKATITDVGIETSRLRSFEGVVNIDEIAALDNAISLAVVNVLTFREQRRKLGVSSV